MTRKLHVFSVLIILALLALACNAPTGKSPASPTDASSAPGITLEPQTDQTATEEPLSTADFSKAALTIGDLPAGFEQLSDEDLETLGISAESLASAFEGKLSKATPQAFAAFINYTSFEVVVSLVLAPLTILEKASFDLYLSNPDGAAKDFSAGAGTTATTLPNFEKVGNSSVGVTFTTGEGATTLRSDVAISRQGAAAVISMVFYLDGSTPQMDINTLAKIMDSKVKAVQ
ncbi:MAG TPA: hypothetical protein PKV95_11220 [Anaerolineaceae bacterium]|nr:hypothetical protein [Longilinea sp.]NMD31624.1 hypothetical protein [Chloroflexota bacterium]HNZ01312.1 hypothetical protein [Anaerolineaceae bacterium]HOD44188.1 hypothetical protein [Anaerolineaceae bacterium]HOH21056.1 hypothetical protein [Anaerolineaceae bacterium]